MSMQCNFTTFGDFIIMRAVIFARHNKISKPERVKKLFDNMMQKLSKKDIHAKCPDISISTIETALLALVKEGYIHKIGAGKNTTYVRNLSYTPD